MRGSDWPPEKRAEVMAYWITGCNVEECSKRAEVPRQTVSDWVSSEVFGRFRPLKKGMVEARVWDMLLKLLAQLINLVELCTSAEYVEKQNARDVAILIGVLYDKVFRLLEIKGASDSEVERILAEYGLGASPDTIEPAAPLPWGDITDDSDRATKRTIIQVEGLDKGEGS